MDEHLFKMNYLVFNSKYLGENDLIYKKQNLKNLSFVKGFF
jgi:hypothetical protein